MSDEAAALSSKSSATWEYHIWSMGAKVMGCADTGGDDGGYTGHEVTGFVRPAVGRKAGHDSGCVGYAGVAGPAKG
jgi:hypothetical protein